ncbi:MAG TPA: MBL fold metallo-hydrolase [Candidatus Krumholzibacteria bacterium]|nr:MBL fold metallo-hydrolase [Candidatus Krumholzibacteria bacterium]
MPRLVRSGALTLALALLAAGAAAAAGTLTITCIDVGQGDATLIQSPSGRTLLFDGGENGRGTSIVVPFLHAAGVDTLDWIVASHYHSDHIGGLDEVMSAIPVRYAVYDRGGSYTTATYNSYVAAAGAKRTTLAVGQVIDMGEGVTVTAINMNGAGVLPAPYTNSTYENEYDVCLKVEYGGFDFVQAGDLTGDPSSGSKDIETTMSALVGDVDVYQVNHHGSYTSSTAAWLSATQPEVSVISVGDGNSYGHPHQVVLDRLQAFSSFVYQTETGSGGTLPASDLRVVHGHVVIATDGGATYTVAGDVWQTDENNQSPAPDQLPAALVLMGNHPNPFNPSTEIRFESARTGAGSLRIVDVAGRLVHDEPLAVLTGINAVRWDGRDAQGRSVPAGVYLYQVTVPGGAAAGRMVLVK